jgi:hypothetical protein
MAYLKQLASISQNIKDLGGKTLIITSETLEHLPEVIKTTGYDGEAISDPDNGLATYVKEQGWLDVAISQKKGYANGMAQPGVLVLRQKNKMDKGAGIEILEKWAIVPSMMNLGGAKDRPDLVQILENVQAKLKGSEAVHQKYKTIDAKQVIWGKIFG